MRIVKKKIEFQCGAKPWIQKIYISQYIRFLKKNVGGAKVMDLKTKIKNAFTFTFFLFIFFISNNIFRVKIIFIVHLYFVSFPLDQNRKVQL